LRQETRLAHEAIELRLNLDFRLANRARYGDLLAGFRGFYAPLESALLEVTGWDVLTPPLDPNVRRRVQLIDQDLAQLHSSPLAVPYTSVSRVFEPGSMAGALGCLYVLEGSALGGRIVARQAAARLGHDLPVAFLTSAGCDDLGVRWRSLQATLDTVPDVFGRSGAQEAISAACATFHELGGWLGITPDRR
jgi:heme oxygenase (biliverdin-IX-beta and delta-forming)